MSSLNPLLSPSSRGFAHIIKCAASTSAAVELAYTKYGTSKDVRSPPLVIAHGLFGQRTNWHSVAKALQSKLGNQIYTVDLRDHGTSPRTDDITYENMALDLELFIRELVAPQCRTERVNLLGHSMGGKVAVNFALAHPEFLHKLIIEDVAPKSYYTPFHATMPKFIKAMRNCNVEVRKFASTAEARRTVDEELADVIKAMRNCNVEGMKFANTTEVRTALDEELADVIEDKPTRQFMLTGIYQDEQSGAFGWRANLAVIEENLRELVGFTLTEDCNDQYTGPTLFLSGSESQYISEVDHPLIVGYFPKVQFDVVIGASHWVHADKPNEFIRCVHRFLTE